METRMISWCESLILGSAVLEVLEFEQDRSQLIHSFPRLFERDGGLLRRPLKINVRPLTYAIKPPGKRRQILACTAADGTSGVAVQRGQLSEHPVQASQRFVDRDQQRPKFNADPCTRSQNGVPTLPTTRRPDPAGAPALTTRCERCQDRVEPAAGAGREGGVMLRGDPRALTCPPEADASKQQPEASKGNRGECGSGGSGGGTNRKG